MIEAIHFHERLAFILYIDMMCMSFCPPILEKKKQKINEMKQSIGTEYKQVVTVSK